MASQRVRPAQFGLRRIAMYQKLKMHVLSHGPSVSPSSAPTPVGGAPCADAVGPVEIVLNGKPKSKTCAKWSKKNCNVPEVEDACPESWAKCVAFIGTYSSRRRTMC